MYGKVYPGLVIITIPAHSVADVGANTIAMVQNWFGARVAGQLLLVIGKGLVPRMLSVIGSVPVLRTVSTCGALEVPTAWLAK